MSMIKDVLYAIPKLAQLLFHSFSAPLWLAFGREDKAERHNKKIQQLKSSS